MEIGGYFNIEIHPKDHYLHEDGIFVNSGRHALEYVLKTIPRIDCLYIPNYTCRVVKVLIEKLSIRYEEYEITKDFRLAKDIELGNYDYILYTNYFGILDSYVFDLSKTYGDKLIVDNAQALFSKPIERIRTVYSPRKFIGVADGGIAYSPTEFIGDLEETDISVERSAYLLSRFDYPSIKGYAASKDSNKTIEEVGLKKMSNLTKSIYKSVDFAFIKERRVQNFIYLHKHLCDINEICIPSLDDFECPMVYPLYVDREGLQKKLIDNGIFVAVYWPYVIQTCKEDSVAVDLAKHIIALPIDQRYGQKEMEYIVECVNKNYAEGKF